MLQKLPTKFLGPLLVKCSGTVAAFALAVALARTLGVEEFGTYSFVVSIIMIAAIPIQSGLPVLATRLVAKADALEDDTTARAYISWSNSVIFGYVSIAALIALVCWWALSVQNWALLAVVALATLSITLRNSGVLRGLGHFIKGSAPDILVRPTVQLVGFVALLQFASEFATRADWAILVYVLASVIACVLSLVWQRLALSKKSQSSQKAGRTQILEWRKAAILLTVVGGGQVFFGHIDTVMLGALKGEADVGAYRVAVQLSMLVIFALSVINQVIQPSLSKLFAQGDMPAFQRLVADSSAYMFLGTLIPAVALAVLAPQLLDLIFGPEYRIAAPALQILICGHVMNVFFGSVGTILNMTGLEAEATRGVIIAIAVNLALDLLLIPLWGLSGAAMASALTIVIWNLILRHYVRQKLGIESAGAIFHVRKFLTGKGQNSQ